MHTEWKTIYQKVVLVILGLVFMAGIYVVIDWIWPVGWNWAPL